MPAFAIRARATRGSPVTVYLSALLFCWVADDPDLGRKKTWAACTLAANVVGCLAFVTRFGEIAGPPSPDAVPAYADPRIALSCEALVLAAIGGAWALACYRNRFRSMVGHCGDCGYDLRATRYRCPECEALSHGDRG